MFIKPQEQLPIEKLVFSQTNIPQAVAATEARFLGDLKGTYSYIAAAVVTANPTGNTFSVHYVGAVRNEKTKKVEKKEYSLFEESLPLKGADGELTAQFRAAINSIQTFMSEHSPKQGLHAIMHEYEAELRPLVENGEQTDEGFALKATGEAQAKCIAALLEDNDPADTLEKALAELVIPTETIGRIAAELELFANTKTLAPLTIDDLKEYAETAFIKAEKRADEHEKLIRKYGAKRMKALAKNAGIPLLVKSKKRK